MFKPEDEYLYDLSTSCNKDVAVAKLLGWMKGIRRAKVIDVTEHGISEDQLKSLHTMEGSLQELLNESREAARLELIIAAENDASFEELEVKEKAAIDADSRFDKAFKYFSDIEEELSKGNDSALKIDQETTEKTGIIHITLPSLNKWAKRKYDISILEENHRENSNNNITAQPIKPTIYDDILPEHGLSKTTAHNALTTFGFLVEAFAHTDDAYIKKNGDPNASKIAEHLAKLAAYASGDVEMDNQGIESIRKLIPKVLKIKNSNFQ